MAINPKDDPNNPLIRAFERRYRGQGIFSIDDIRVKAGKPAFKVGHQYFKTPTQAADYIKSRGLQTYAYFNTQMSPASFPRIGAGEYTGIERMIEAIKAEPSLRGIAETLEIHRYSYGADNKTIAALYQNELIRNVEGQGRTMFGFQVPSDTGPTVLRMFAHGKEMTSAAIEEMLGTAGYEFNKTRGEFKGKISKRMQNLVNEEIFATTHDRPFRVHTLDFNHPLLSGLTDAAKESGFDGLVMGNPAMLDDKVRQMRRRADRLRAGGDDRSARAVERKLEELQSKIEAGGSYEAFRAYGLEGRRGMVKGDIYFPARKNWEATARKLGIKDPSLVDFVVGNPSNITPEFGLGIGAKRSYFTLKMNEVNRFVRGDIESMSAYPELYPLNTLKDHSLNVLRGRVDKFMETGEISEDFRSFLQETVQRSLEDLQKGETIPAVLNRQARAQRLLDLADLHIKPTENAPYAQEFYSSMLEWWRSSDPKFFMPGVIGGHVRHNIFALAEGMTEAQIGPGEIGFNRRIGIMMHPETIGQNVALHGGFDLDDLLREHLRIITHPGEAPELRAAGIRLPMSYGETVGLKVSEASLPEMMHAMRQADPEMEKRYLKSKVRIDDLENRIKSMQNQVQHLEDRIFNRAVRTDPGEVGRITDLERRIDQAIAEREALKGELAAGGQIYESAWDIMEPSIPKMTREEFKVFDYDQSIKGTQIPVEKRPIYKSFEEWNAEKERTYSPIEFGGKFGPEDLRLGEDIAGSTELQKFLFRQQIAYSQAKGALGNYVNLNVLTDSLRDQIKAKGITEGIAPYTPTEAMIDVLTQGEPKMVNGELITFEKASERVSAQLYGLAEAVAHQGLKLPRELFDTRFKEKGVMRRKFFEYLQQESPGIDEESIFLDHNVAQEAAWDRDAMQRVAYQDVKETMERERRAFTQRLKLPEGIEEEFFSAEEKHHAERVATTATVAQRRMEEGIFAEDWSSPFAYGVIDSLKNEARIHGAGHARRVMTEAFDESGEFGEHGMRVMGAFIQQFGKDRASRLMFDYGMADMATKTEAYFRTGGWQNMGDTPEIISKNEELRDRVIRKEDMLREVDTSLDTDVLDREVRSITGVPGSIKAKEAGKAHSAADSLVEVAGTKFENMTWQGIKDLYKEHPGVKQATIGAAALIAGSFIYRRFRDRTPEDLQGPPLLPGGGFYEQSLAAKMPPPMQGSASPYETGGGVTYRVVARGDYDPQQARDQAEQITGTKSSGTIYNTRVIGRFGREIPEALAKAFSRGTL